MKRHVMLLAVVMCWPGCVGPDMNGPGKVSPVDPDEQESTVTREDIASWVREADWLISPLLPAPEGATRVGVLVELQYPSDMPAMEARILGGGTALTDWAPMIVTWSEGAQHVAIRDFEVVGDGAELRIPVGAIDAIRMLQWNAVIPGDPGEEESSDDDHTMTFPIRAELQGLGIVTREMWGARATRCSSADTKTKMAIHYTVTPSTDPAARVRAIQIYHQDTRGWCDIGYHFLVGVDGSIYEGRPLHLIGAHVASHNTGNIGISFIGCFQPGSCSSMGPTVPPEQMIDAGGRLLGTLSDLFGIPLDTDRVRGHRDYPGASTDCPGDNLYVRIDDMLAIGNHSGLDAPPADPPEDPPPDDPPPGTSCEALGCDACEASAGCDWCASGGACLDGTEACVWRGEVSTTTCWDALWPCAVATCWNPTATIETCGTWSIEEDFSSGAYSVHRYWATLPAGNPVTLRLQRTLGTYAPAILVSDRAGRMIYGGGPTALSAGVAVTDVTDGRTGDVAEVTLESATPVDALVYVTGWQILDAAFTGSLPTTSRYSLSAAQDCSPDVPDDPPPGGVCDGLACGVCETSAGCTWCASRGVCADETAACSWTGEVGTTECWDALWPCAVATCWNPTATFSTCGAWIMDEDFSSGAYSVHRYGAFIPTGGPVTLRLERTDGTFQPALVVADRAGRVISGGEAAALHPTVTAPSAVDGRTGAFASVTLEASAATDVYVYVTGWSILDAGFAGSLPTSVRYRFSATHDCSGGTDPPVLDDTYGGLTQSGSEIPREGLYNATLHSVVGLWYEPYGMVVSHDGQDWVSGSVSWFGGPSDTGVSSTETGAITGEVLRSLNDPLHPDPATLAASPEDYYYVAMRWNYTPNGRTWWQDARLVVLDPATGTRVVVRPVDWGPNTSTGRIIDLSPQSMDDLGVSTDDTVYVAFAPPGTPLGIVPPG